MKISNKIKTLLTATLMIMSVAVSNADTIVKNDNSYSNYIEIAKKAKGDKLIIASAKSYADSLSSINLLYKNNDKLMLIDDNTKIDDMIRTLNPSEIIIIGGPKTISEKTESIIRKYSNNVKRIWGKNRYQTNDSTTKGQNKVIVVSGENFADALSATNIMKNENVPVMLVRKNQKTLNGKTALYTIGGPDSVTNSFGKRIWGKDRYQTNLMTKGKGENITVNGDDFRLPLMSTNIVFAKGTNYQLDLTNKKLNETSNPINIINKKGSNTIVDILNKKDNNDKKTIDKILENKPVTEKDKPSVVVTKPVTNKPVEDTKVITPTVDDKNKENTAVKPVVKPDVKPVVKPDVKPVVKPVENNKEETNKPVVTPPEESVSKPTEDNNHETVTPEPVEDNKSDDFNIENAWPNYANKPIENFTMPVSNPRIQKDEVINGLRHITVNNKEYTIINSRSDYLKAKANAFKNIKTNLLMLNTKMNLNEISKRLHTSENYYGFGIVPQVKTIGKTRFENNGYVIEKFKPELRFMNGSDEEIREIILENRKKISQDLKEMNLDQYSNLEDKLFNLQLFMKKKYTYYTGTNVLEERAINSLTKYGHGVCEGFVNYATEALRQLKIPACTVLVNENQHIINRILLEDGNFIDIDPTGYVGGWSPGTYLPRSQAFPDKYKSTPIDSQDSIEFAKEYMR